MKLINLSIVLGLWCLATACAPNAPVTSTAVPSTSVVTSAATAVATTAATSATTAVPTTSATTRPTSAATTVATTASTAAPTTVVTSSATTAATGSATTSGTSGAARFAIQALDKSVNLVDLSGKSTLLTRATEQFQPGRPWYAVGETVYAISTGPGPSGVYAIDARGARKLDFIPTQFYGFAPSTSGTPLLAWGAGVLQLNGTAQVDLSAPDGSNKKSVAKETLSGEPRVYRVEKFSRDAARVYFGKEPTGLGGYILFSGLTNLWTVNVADGKTTEVVSEKTAGAFICIDAIAPNEQLAATHCSRRTITVLNLSNPSAGAQTITPGGNIQFQQLGSAVFSPDSSRVAFAVARGDPNNEQGWAMVSDGLSGTGRMIAQSAAKDYYNVVAWPEANAILLQSIGVSPTPSPSVWVVRPDGTGLTKLSDGTFLAQLGGTR